MSRIITKYPCFLAVVHVVGTTQAINQTRTAVENGADGVFLINHWDEPNTVPCRVLTEIAMMVRIYFPEIWIGVNYLDLSPEEAFRELPREADGLWTDSLRPLEKLSGGRLRFGGVGFKHQKKLVTLEQEVKKALLLTDVLTTSGIATGVAASTEKIELIRGVAGTEKLIGLASGVTSKNISLYLPLVNFFLVATGISKSFTEFDPKKIREVSDVIKDFKR